MRRSAVLVRRPAVVWIASKRLWSFSQSAVETPFGLTALKQPLCEKPHVTRLMGDVFLASNVFFDFDVFVCLLIVAL